MKSVVFFKLKRCALTELVHESENEYFILKYKSYVKGISKGAGLNDLKFSGKNW